MGLGEFCNNILSCHCGIIRLNGTHIGVKNMSKDFENSNTEMIVKENTYEYIGLSKYKTGNDVVISLLILICISILIIKKI